MRYTEPMERLIDKIGAGRFWIFPFTKKKIKTDSIEYTVGGTVFRIYLEIHGLLKLHIEEESGNMYGIYIHNVIITKQAPSSGNDSATPAEIFYYDEIGEKGMSICTVGEIGICTYSKPPSALIKRELPPPEHRRYPIINIAEKKGMYLTYLPLKRYREEIQEVRKHYLHSLSGL